MNLILQQLKNLCIGHHRLIEIRQGDKVIYMVQQRLLCFWVDTFTKPFEDYETAKSCYEDCKTEYPLVPKVKRVLLDSSPESERMWDTPSLPITPTPPEVAAKNVCEELSRHSKEEIGI